MKTTKKTLSRNPVQSLTALIVVLGVIIIGVQLLVSSHAQSPYVAVTADNGSLTPPATVQTCSGSSDGRCIVFSGCPPTAYVSRQGQKLYCNGNSYTFMGINMYYANVRNSCAGYNDGDANSMFATDLATYDKATNQNARVIRAWFTQVQATTNGTLDWSAFDHTLDAAKAAGFKVIPVLGNQWGVCDNSANIYNDYHSLAWYQSGYTTAPDMSGPLSYETYVSDVVARYKDNPTILAWELMNEANAGTDTDPTASTITATCPSGSVAEQALFNWAKNMTSIIKSIDPNHLVDIGTGTNACGTTGALNTDIEAVPDNDFCDFHDYNNSTTPISTDLQYMLTACQGLNKPVLVGETGIAFGEACNSITPAQNCSVFYDPPAHACGTPTHAQILTAAQILAKRASLFSAKFSAYYKNGVVGVLPWVWNGSSNTIDGCFEIDPGDPLLSVMAQY